MFIILIIVAFQFSHDCSDCRRVSRFGVGQNLYLLKQVDTDDDVLLKHVNSVM